MLDQQVLDALNKQINHEMTAAYNYLAMEAWFEHANLTGFAQWMHQQRLEELDHATKLFQFVNHRGGRVQLDAVAKPNAEFKDPRDVFAKAFALERKNTEAIHELYELATQKKDYATQSMLKWFIDEQVEEEDTTSEIEALLEMAGDDTSALLMLNRQLGERVAAP